MATAGASSCLPETRQDLRVVPRGEAGTQEVRKARRALQFGAIRVLGDWLSSVAAESRAGSLWLDSSRTICPFLLPNSFCIEGTTKDAKDTKEESTKFRFLFFVPFASFVVPFIWAPVTG